MHDSVFGGAQCCPLLDSLTHQVSISAKAVPSRTMVRTERITASLTGTAPIAMKQSSICIAQNQSTYNSDAGVNQRKRSQDDP